MQIDEAAQGGRVLRALAASLSVMALLLAFLPAEEWDKPSLAEELQLSALQGAMIIVGFGCLMFAITTAIQWREVREWHRSRLLERACTRAHAVWRERAAFYEMLVPGSSDHAG